MSSAYNSRRSVKIRRRGRHAAPSRVEKIAGKATVAAPAVAIAGGVIIGVPATAGAATTGTAAATDTASVQVSAQTSSASASVSRSSRSLSGTLGCSSLEQLWEAAGGTPSEAFTAAEIAMAESGGNQFAVSPTADYGYWQINKTAHGSMATFDPIGNAKAAISISSDGSNWNPWTTYRTGAYKGKC